ncbi:MAG TPA: hypothetical protein VIK96_03085 [Bacilli bacterium]
MQTGLKGGENIRSAIIFLGFLLLSGVLGLSLLIPFSLGLGPGNIFVIALVVVFVLFVIVAVVAAFVILLSENRRRC